MRDRTPDEILRQMLVDILREAELVRPHDPVRAGHLDDAAADLRIVIAERATKNPEISEACPDERPPTSVPRFSAKRPSS